MDEVERAYVHIYSGKKQIIRLAFVVFEQDDQFMIGLSNKFTTINNICICIYSLFSPDMTNANDLLYL